MPSSEDCFQAQADVEKMYIDKIMKEQGYDRKAAEKIASLTRYDVKVKELGLYTGPYSCY